MSITIKLNSISSIEKRLGIDEGGKVQQFFTQTCARRNDKYVPFLTGKLKNTVEVGKTKYTYIQPYAKKQYYTNKGNGIRGAYWADRMVSAEKDIIAREVENYIKR